MRGEAWISEVLGEMKKKSLDRRLRVWPAAGGRITVEGRTCLNFSSNDYLDLSSNPEVKTAARNAVRDFGAGSTASRLMSGTLVCHEALEQRLAAFKGYDAALLFGSGWLTNAGVIPALVDREDAVFADRLVHASIIDATILSRATLYRFDHNDPDHLAELMEKHAGGFKKKLVVTESVFSMDGDLAPLEDICKVVDATDAMLMVDEAHSTGVFGQDGSGMVKAAGLEQSVNISMGTISKALGGYGGFVACSKAIHELLVNRARSFIFTTALPPAVTGAALGALAVLGRNPGLGSKLLENAAVFRRQLRERGLDTLSSASQIVPVLVGDPERAVALSRRLLEHGIIAMAVRPPTVPPKTARLRLSVTLAHSRDDLAGAADVIAACFRERL